MGIRSAFVAMSIAMFVVACSSSSDDTSSPVSDVGDEGTNAPTVSGERDVPGGSVAPEAPETTPSGGTCVAGYEYCGSNKIIGDRNTLYECKGPGEPAVVATCERGCIINPSAVNDTCAPERVTSPARGREVTYAFGEKHSRYRLGYHTGDDYATPVGTPAIAVRKGKIRWSNDNGGDYGRWMALDADNGRTYVYAHLDRRLYPAGTEVALGQVIALTGNTGLSTGPHLHFEDRPLGSTDNAQARKPMW